MEQPSWQRFLYLGFPENYHLAMENHHFCDRRYIVLKWLVFYCHASFSGVTYISWDIWLIICLKCLEHVFEITNDLSHLFPYSVLICFTMFTGNLMTSILPFIFHPTTSGLSEFPRELSAKVTMVGFPACPAHNIDALVFRWGEWASASASASSLGMATPGGQITQVSPTESDLVPSPAAFTAVTW